MKKFCSKCGSQLDLGKRFCDSCGAFNPFFISAFSATPSNTANPEKNRDEKSEDTRITNDLKEDEWRKSLQEEVRRNRERLVKEELEKERLERERIEQNLIKEIARVKEDSELHQKEAKEMVTGVREELQIIEEENKRLKREVDALSKMRAQLKAETVQLTQPVEPVNVGSSRPGIAVMVLLSILVLGGSVIGYLYYTQSSEKAVKSAVSEPAKNPDTAIAIAPAKTDAPKIDTSIAAAVDTTSSATQPKTDTVPERKLLAMATPPLAPRKPITNSQPEKGVTGSGFILTPSKVKSDIVGKKLSGCGITIRKADEIKSIENLVLVEKLGEGTWKYKLTAKIAQDNDTYSATPYVYYNSYGVLIKIDGTNCE